MDLLVLSTTLFTSISNDIPWQKFIFNAISDKGLLKCPAWTFQWNEWLFLLDLKSIRWICLCQVCSFYSIVLFVHFSKPHLTQTPKVVMKCQISVFPHHSVTFTLNYPRLEATNTEPDPRSRNSSNFWTQKPIFNSILDHVRGYQRHFHWGSRLSHLTYSNIVLRASWVQVLYLSLSNFVSYLYTVPSQ